MKWKWGVIVLLTLAVISAGFWLTGGRSLAHLYFNYLMQDIPDKKLGWQDFAELGTDNLSRGYYAGSLGIV